MTAPLPVQPTIPVVDVATGRRCDIHTGTPSWKALNEWVIAHGLDPNDILARTGIVRDADAYCIRYTGFVRDEQGNRILDRDSIPLDGSSEVGLHTKFVHFDGVEQGEAPPLPFPDIIERLLEAA